MPVQEVRTSIFQVNAAVLPLVVGCESIELYAACCLDLGVPLVALNLNLQQCDCERCIAVSMRQLTVTPQPVSGIHTLHNIP